MNQSGQTIILDILLDQEKRLSVERAVEVENLPRSGDFVVADLIPRDLVPLQTLEVTAVYHVVSSSSAIDPGRSTCVMTRPVSPNFDADVVAAGLVDAGWIVVDRGSIDSALAELVEDPA